MSVKPENPLAFPRQNDEQHYGELGMSLRDYFAGQALNGIIASDSADVARQAKKAKLELEDLVARMSYLMADAMLAERERES